MRPKRDTREALQRRYFATVGYRRSDDPVVSAYADPKLDFIRRHARLRGRILDVGCGNGAFTERLSRDGATITGLDCSQELLHDNPHKRLVCGDAAALPFRDAAFDLVFGANLLHHVTDRDAVIQEMCRVSRRYVVLIEPNRYNPLMFAFSIVVRAERGGLRSHEKRLREEVGRAGLHVLASCTTGMISQNNTPSFLVPWLRRFDRDISWGEYIVMIAAQQATLQLDEPRMSSMFLY